MLIKIYFYRLEYSFKENYKTRVISNFICLLFTARLKEIGNM